MRSPAGIVIGGIPITLLDTAGMRESVDLVEQVGSLVPQCWLTTGWLGSRWAALQLW